MAGREVVVKLLPCGYEEGRFDYWLRQFPGNRPVWGNCRFEFDRSVRNYDWLVVYNDLPRGERKFDGETLACPQGRTILVAPEPSSVRTYGSGFLSQFGMVVTYQEPWAISHPNLIFSHAGEHWFYGLYGKKLISYDEMKRRSPPAKERLLSTVCSSKRQRHTMHFDRYDFTQRLSAALPEMEVFGHGVRDMEDKSEALDPYRYHVAIENQICPHYWSEKLADAFLAFTLPFYCGCPNVSDYFDPESYIPIDIQNLDASLAAMREALAGNAYEKRLPAIVEARRKVLDEYNLFSLLHRIIRDRDPGPGGGGMGARIYSQHTLWRHHPHDAARGLLEKMRVRAHHARINRAAALKR